MGIIITTSKHSDNGLTGRNGVRAMPRAGVELASENEAAGRAMAKTVKTAREIQTKMSNVNQGYHVQVHI